MTQEKKTEENLEKEASESNEKIIDLEIDKSTDQGNQLPPPQTFGTEPTSSEPVKKKHSRKWWALIIIFAIILPVLVLIGLGFLIWGIVVGFQSCIESCTSCCDQCNACANCCDDCSQSCSNCGATCDSCGGSISSLSQDETLLKSNHTTILKNLFHNSYSMVKWYYYIVINFLEKIFLK